jgi:cytochrome c oxidase subunit 2
MSTVEPGSDFARAILHVYAIITWATAIIGLIVFVVLAYILVRFRARPDAPLPAQLRGHTLLELGWTIGPALVLLLIAIPTIQVIFRTQTMASPPGALQVTVRGWQWWWEFQYPDLGVVTANELHVPVSDAGDRRPTYLRLESADVVHSFWLPQLNGKTDVIPNRVNNMWIEPLRAGIYLGQCAEYCGTQHANMLLRVIAHPPAEFDAWVASQRASAVVEASAAAGQALFQSVACINCHRVGGTVADGVFGPDLTHLMSRATIGAGAATNTPANLRAWLNNPDQLKPGVLMPAMKLSDAEIDQVVAYLATLK